MILHDQDTMNCIELKQNILKLCSESKRPVLVRIACQELEAWYFGDLEAVAKAYNRPKLKELTRKKKVERSIT